MDDFLKGLAAYKAEDYPEAARWFSKAAEQGDTTAQFNLGVMYDKGQGVAQDDGEALRWYLKAAELGNALAQYCLGLMYYRGDGVAQDDREAVHLWRKAAEQGHALAQSFLGHMYQEGRGVTQDYVEAHKWLNLAFTLGEMSAKKDRQGVEEKMATRQIAEAQKEAVKWLQAYEKKKLMDEMDDFEKGFVNYQAKNYHEALRWLRKAAEQGHPKAQVLLGVMYVEGRGVAHDEREAGRCWHKAAEQGDDEAQYCLGFLYEKGRGVAQDDSEAVRWYRKAAEQGNALAQFGLGAMYGNGRGVAQDYVQARIWWNIASALGHQLPLRHWWLGVKLRRLSPQKFFEAQSQAKQWLEGFQKRRS